LSRILTFSWRFCMLPSARLIVPSVPSTWFVSVHLVYAGVHCHVVRGLLVPHTRERINCAWHGSLNIRGWMQMVFYYHMIYSPETDRHVRHCSWLQSLRLQQINT
jgi:hypothetical protein